MEKFGDLINAYSEMLKSISDEEWIEREKVVKRVEDMERYDFLNDCIKKFSQSGFSEVKRLELKRANSFIHQIEKKIVVEYQQQTITEDAEFINNPFLSYVFLGDIGRGKTLLAHKLAWEDVKASKSVLFIGCNAISVIAADIKKGDRSFLEFIKKWNVVFDDIMRPIKPHTENGIDLINDVISERSELNMRTLITSNDSIMPLLKQTTIDRMHRNWKTINFKGESLRKKIEI